MKRLLAHLLLFGPGLAFIAWALYELVMHGRLAQFLAFWAYALFASIAFVIGLRLLAEK